jgi:hypothetical protein
MHQHTALGARRPSAISRQQYASNPSTLKRRVKPKPAWSSYLTDDNRFALTKEEILRKKQLLISKHNILNDGSKGSTRTPPSSKAVASGTKTYSAESYSEKSHVEDFNDVTALDLISSSFDQNNTKSGEKTAILGSRKPNRSIEKKSHAKKMTQKQLLSSSESESEYSLGESNDESDFDGVSNDDEEADDNGDDGASNEDASRQDEGKNLSVSTTKVRRNISFGLTPSPASNRYRSRNNSPKSAAAAADTYKVDRQSVRSREQVYSSKFDSPNDTTMTPRSRIALNTSATSARSVKRRQTVQVGVTASAYEKVADQELTEILGQIRTLNGELRYYEELKGKRSVFDTEVGTGTAGYIRVIECGFSCGSVCKVSATMLLIVHVFSLYLFIHSLPLYHRSSSSPSAKVAPWTVNTTCLKAR